MALEVLARRYASEPERPDRAGINALFIGLLICFYSGERGLFGACFLNYLLRESEEARQRAMPPRR